MASLFRKFFTKLGILPGYGLRAGLMFSYIFLIIASLLIVKPVRTSLFLTRFGPEQLPYVFMLVAAVSALVAVGYFRLSSIIRLGRLITHSLWLSALIFILTWVLLQSAYVPDWFIYAFYVWVAIFGVIGASQFWLLANYVFNAREAKRLFGFLGAGAITGGIFGGYLTNFIVPLIGTQNLILICVVFIFVNLIKLRLIWIKHARKNYHESVSARQRKVRQVTTKHPIQLLFSSRHLVYMAGLIGIGVLVASLVEYQFNAIASEKIREEDLLTAFFGFWYSSISLAALAIQLFMTTPVLRKFGVTPSLYFLPSGILIGATALLVAPSLGTAVLIRLLEGGFKQSINKAGLELLALPIPSVLKNRTKTFTDMFVPNTAEGIGGLLLLILIGFFGFSVQYLSIVIFAFLGIWVALIHLVKREYVGSFRQAIEKRSVNLEELTVNVNDASVREMLERILEGENSKQILYVLQILEETNVEEIAPFLNRLIAHPAPVVKAQVLRMAAPMDDLDFKMQAHDLVQSDDEIVQAAAIDYICRRAPDPVAVLEEYLKSADIRVQAAAGLAAAQIYRSNPQMRKAMDVVRLRDASIAHQQSLELSAADQEYLRINEAEIIGQAQAEELYPYLHELLQVDSVRILRAAVKAAGMTGAPEFIPGLIDHLDTKLVRSYARLALAEYGDDVIDELVEKLEDSDTKAMLRYGIIKVLALIGSRKAVKVLQERLDQENVERRYIILKALNKIRDKSPELKIDAKRINALIEKEVQHRYGLLEVLHQHRESGKQSSDQTKFDIESAQGLLERALEERLTFNLERIFRLLGLHYPQDDIYYAYLGIVSQNAVLHANALEFLENLLDFQLKQQIIPLTDTKHVDHSFSTGTWRWDEREEVDQHYLSRLLQASDSWLNACALFFIAQSGDEQWRSIAQQRTSSNVPLVKETAEYAVNRLKSPE
jgi:AAA family ATP:ADP antiporter